jgi:hypothetical protein
MLLALVRGAFRWDQPGFPAPQIQHVSDLPRQRTALLKDPSLREQAECLVLQARQDLEEVYGRVGLQLEEGVLIVEFLEQARTPAGPELLQNRGVSGQTYKGANGFLATYIMERWKAQYRSYRVEATYCFEGVTAVRALLVVGGISTEEILNQQSKGGANAMHDRQIEYFQLKMAMLCVIIICWQGDTGTTASGLTYECMAMIGVLLQGTLAPDISYSGRNEAGARYRATADLVFLGRLNDTGTVKKDGPALAAIYAPRMRAASKFLIPFWSLDACANPSYMQNSKLIMCTRLASGNLLLTALYCLANALHGDMKQMEGYVEPPPQG